MAVRWGKDSERAQNEVESAKEPLETGHVQVSNNLEPELAGDGEYGAIREESGGMQER